MIEVEWLGPEERVIPACGVAKVGETIELPLDVAKSFVEQKLARYLKTERKPKKEVE